MPSSELPVGKGWGYCNRLRLAAGWNTRIDYAEINNRSNHENMKTVGVIEHQPRLPCPWVTRFAPPPLVFRAQLVSRPVREPCLACGLQLAQAGYNGQA